MEPLDPPNNVDGSRFSKRRISSILKAPRKSARFSDPEQQENVVECAKPVEKRASRRVSFAPANDVLLFSKDAKNAFPDQAHSQELVTAAAETTQNRIQVTIAEDGSQQILGMENLLKAPLHTSQQRDKVNVDTLDDFGEKTVMFSTDDAFMDMTQSHTINIANDAEILGDISFRNYDILATVKEKDRMFTVADELTDMTRSHTVNMTNGLLSTRRNMDGSGEKRSSLASMPCLDPGFENFLASLSKPSGPNTNAMITRMTPAVGTSSEETSSSLAQIKTQKADVDKENQAPTCVSAILEKSLNNSRKIRELSYGGALCPKDDVSMDITEAQTGRIHISGPSSNRVSARITSGVAPSSAETTSTNINLSQLNTPRAGVEYQLLSAISPEDAVNMDMTEAQTGRIIGGTGCDDPFQFLFPTQDMYPHCGDLKTADITPLQLSSEALGSSNHKGMETSLKPSFKAKAQRHQEILDTEDNYREKTVRFTADEACMDVTQSHTVNIATDFNMQAHQNLDFLPTCGENTLRFATDDTTMDMTQCLTVNTASNLVSNSGLPLKKKEDDTFSPCRSRSSSAHSVNTASNKFLPPFSKPSDPNVSSVVARMTPTAATFSGGTSSSADDINMDMTEAHVGCIFESDAFMDITETQTGRIVEILGTDDPLECLFPTKDMYPQSGNLRKTMMTSTQQNNEAHGPSNSKGMVASLKTSLKTEMQAYQVESDVEFDCKEKTVRFTANEACMDVTQSHTVNIATDFNMLSHQKMDLTGNGEKTMRFTATDANMDVTQSHTVNIATDLNLQRYQNANLPGNGEKTMRFTANEASMDVTKSHTVNITTDLNRLSRPSVGILPANGEKTVRFTAREACMDVTQSHTVNIATDLNIVSNPRMDLPGNGEKTMRFTATDANMDVTRSHTVNIATDCHPKLSHNVDFLPTSVEKTMRFTANEAAMDVTQSHTVNIATDLNLQPYQHVDLPGNREKTVKFTANEASMDVTKSHTVNIATDFKRLSRPSVGILPSNGEKTVRFTASEACMDVTQSHTVNIATDLNMVSHQKMDLPGNGEKTMKFTATDANMDVTRSHTVNIATDCHPKLSHNVDFLPTSVEKTMRFTANEAVMDVTQSHTVNIATDLSRLSRQNVSILPANGEKTVRFTANEACMDVTQSHTVNIATDFEPKHEIVHLLPTNGEKTVKFTTNDATMDMTQCVTLNITSNVVSESILPQVLPPHQNMEDPSVNERKSETSGLQRNGSSVQASDREFKKSQLKMSEPSARSKEEATDARIPQESIDANGFLVHLKTLEPEVNNENEAPVLVSAFTEKPVNESMTGCSEVNASMVITEAQTGDILQHTCTDEPSQFPSSVQNRNSELLKKMEVTLPPSKEGSSNPDDVEITKLTHSPCLNETETDKEPEPRNAACPVAQNMESSPSAADQDDDALCSRKSRRKSLADLQSRVRRLSRLINAAPDAVTIDSCTAPLPQLEHDLDKNSEDKTISLPELEPEPAHKMGLVNTEDEVQSFTQEEQPSVSATATPFSLKTQLISRLSVGGFKPKLPQRSKPDEANKRSSAGEHTTTISSNVHKLSNFDNDVSDIFDEELGSYEDVSETLDTRSPKKISEIESPSREFNMVEPSEDDVFEEDFNSTNHGQKRPLPEDENNTEEEKRMKASPETAEMALRSGFVECETINYCKNSHTASIRCEAASESTIKHSLFESQLEDYTSDAQKKLEEGTITVLEFFKLFNIDFVIHNPRQSVLPGRLLSDTDATSMDLLKDRHISRPKQMVYEADVLTLTEEVERLKVRMWDLDKPLQTVNRPLWEEVKQSSENQLKSFGAKLKERNNFFRKTSKVQSHEMKEVLYSNLVQANLEEQQKLRGTIEQADEMIKSLDDCISELETELAAVEENDFEDKPSLNSLQKEMKKVTETLADNDKQISELEMEKKQNSSKLNRLKAETRNLESHINVLNMVNEWRFKERRDNSTIYTFLNETVYLHLVYEKSDGTDPEYGSERKITHIALKSELDDEKSQFHARIVHKLLSQYIEGESAWVEKYPTSRHVPKLLHDVSLVVSRCRLLGEELRLLKLWGGLRLDILDINCVDTRVHIVFSNLKTFSKFEVVFAVSLTNHLYVLQVESFKNVVGSTTIHQIEDIVAGFIPAKNLLTKIVKKIHNTLLC